MLVYPNIDPIAITLGVIEIRWYSLAYLASFFVAHYLLKYQLRFALQQGQKHIAGLSPSAVHDFLFYVFIAAIVGGRLGEMFFYQFDRWLSDPVLVFYIWQGGMSHHGGLIGVSIAIYFFAHKNKIPFLAASDLLMMPMALAIFLVRGANFINNELWGKPTDMPWGVLVEWQNTLVVRHPTQIYQSLTGLLLLIGLYCLFKNKVKTGVLTYCFILATGVMRFLIEFLKAPYPGQISLGDFLNTGQVLSIGVVALGCFIAYHVHRPAK